jgi:purine-binding chemotaxis protein CheW
MEDIITGGTESAVTMEMAVEISGETYSQVSGDAALFLTFMLGKDLFGIQVSDIREVIEYKKIFRIPRVPDYIMGVINLRGEVVPIVDLYSRFYNSSCNVTGSSSVVVVEIDDDNQKIPIGVMIDSVEAVTELNQNRIEAVPEIGSRIRTDFIDGIGKLENQFVILLKMQNILNIEELSGIDDGIN